MLLLTPNKIENTPKLPDNNYDICRAAVEVLDLDSPLNLPDKAITVLRIRTGHFTLNICINTLRKADRLVVTFTGARSGFKESTNFSRPMFARRNWDVLFNAPILAISDPQTEIDWNSTVPRTGFYFGTFQNDLALEILALISKVCDALAIDRNKVVMYGSSAGGSAAILIGSRRPENTSIITTCPFLRPSMYREDLVAIGARAAGGDLEAWQKMSAETPYRNQPLTALRDAIKKGHQIRLFVAQNVRDKSTIHRHFPGLWRRFDIDPEGGVSPNGRVMAAIYDSAEAGHGQEPPSCSAPLIQMAYNFFEQPLTTRPKKDHPPQPKKPPKSPTSVSANTLQE